MFAHVVSNMILLISHLIREKVPLLLFKLYVPGSKLVVHMDQGQKRLKTKQSLREHEISDSFSDEISEVPSDIFSDSDTDSGDDRKKRIVATENESECETESSADDW
jgi:hypothetical protein